MQLQLRASEVALVANGDPTHNFSILSDCSVGECSCRCRHLLKIPASQSVHCRMRGYFKSTSSNNFSASLALTEAPDMVERAPAIQVSPLLGTLEGAGML